MPVAAAKAGILGEQIGLRSTIAVMAAIHLISTLAVLLTPLARVRDLPSHAHSPTEPPR